MSLAAILATLVGGSATAAEPYPNRPITVIIPFAAGGPVDIEARSYAIKLSEILGQPVILDYKVGGGTSIGADYVAKSKPDGYTLLANSGTLTTLPSYYKGLRFDIEKDLAPITQISKRASVLVASPNAPFKTFNEYLAYARANPGKINYGTNGMGDIVHLTGEWLSSLTKTKVTFVPYKGAGPMFTDLQGGQIDASSANLTFVMPLIQAGKVHPLAVFSTERSKLLPDVPTVAELGVSGFAVENYLGFFAPAGTPEPIIKRLNEALVQVVRLPATKAEMDAQGSVPVGSTPEQFAKVVSAEIARWKKVVQNSSIKFAN